jgi:hypothetical protein
MKKEVDIPYVIGDNASAVMKFLESKKVTHGEALDVLSMALIISAFNANVPKKDFMENTDAFWDLLKEEVKDNEQSGKYTH